MGPIIRIFIERLVMAVVSLVMKPYCLGRAERALNGVLKPIAVITT